MTVRMSATSQANNAAIVLNDTFNMVTGCPICSKPTLPEHKPFCSDRCRQVDLNRWFTGSYAIPVPDSQISEEDIDALERAIHNGLSEN